MLFFVPFGCFFLVPFVGFYFCPATGLSEFVVRVANQDEKAEEIEVEDFDIISTRVNCSG